MKKIYLVKRDPSLPAAEDNWIIMDRKEFESFIESEEGRKRIRNFALLDALDDDDSAIVAECGEEKAVLWEKERLRRSYCERRDRNLFTEPFEAPDSGTQQPREEPADPDCMEEQILRKLMKEEVALAMNGLRSRERQLVRRMYFGDRCISERDYAEVFGENQTDVHRLKRRALKRLRSSLKY